MSGIKPVPEVLTDCRIIKNSLHDSFHFDARSVSTSPKISELRARHEIPLVAEKSCIGVQAKLTQKEK